MTDFLFNPARLSFQMPCVLGGLLLCGDKGEHRRAGNGDCIILDGATGLIGVADGSERSPQASRQCLEGIAAHLLSVGRHDRRPGYKDLLEAAQAVLDNFRYEDRTTFLCILPEREGSVFYLSGGDSILMQLDPSSSSTLFRNQSNMGFAGRSLELLDFGHLQVHRGELILLATDGLWDVQGKDDGDFIHSIFGELKKGHVHGAPAQLVQSRHPAFCHTERPYDDLGLVVLDPFRIESFGHRVLIGGTDRDSELSYQRGCKRGDFPDRDLSLPEGSRSLWVFPDEIGDFRLSERGKLGLNHAEKG